MVIFNSVFLSTGPISKPKCVSNGLIPPKTLLIWNTIENEQSDLQFTYNVLYCYKPSLPNKFCYRPPHGYNILINCSDLTINASVTSSVKECNVTSLFKTLFPNLFDVHEQVSGRPAIFFIVNLGNVQSDNYSPSNYCNPLESGNDSSSETQGQLVGTTGLTFAHENPVVLTSCPWVSEDGNDFIYMYIQDVHVFVQ